MCLQIVPQIDYKISHFFVLEMELKMHKDIFFVSKLEMEKIPSPFWIRDRKISVSKIRDKNNSVSNSKYGQKSLEMKIILFLN